MDLDNLNGRTNFIDKSLMEEMKRLDSLQTLLQKQVNPLARGTDLNAQQLAIEQTRATLESTETYIKALGQQKQGQDLLNQRCYYFHEELAEPDFLEVGNFDRALLSHSR